jgi:hypothetical protein
MSCVSMYIIMYISIIFFASVDRDNLFNAPFLQQIYYYEIVLRNRGCLLA